MAKSLPEIESVYAGNGFVETRYGYFYFDNPVFDLNDIAHSLGMLTRYNGHCTMFYSVAEHSVMVANIMHDLELGSPLEGLLHDATEAYLSDVPAPFKQFFPDWQRYDKEMDSKLRKQFGLPAEKTEGCKRADWIALFIEAYELMRDQGAGFPDPAGVRGQALALRNRYLIEAMPPQCATNLFRKTYAQYQPA